MFVIEWTFGENGNGVPDWSPKCGEGVEAHELVDLRFHVDGRCVDGQLFGRMDDELHLDALDVRFGDGDQGLERTESRIEQRTPQLLVLVFVVKGRRVQLRAALEQTWLDTNFVREHRLLGHRCKLDDGGSADHRNRARFVALTDARKEQPARLRSPVEPRPPRDTVLVQRVVDVVHRPERVGGVEDEAVADLRGGAAPPRKIFQYLAK